MRHEGANGGAQIGPVMLMMLASWGVGSSKSGANPGQRAKYVLRVLSPALHDKHAKALRAFPRPNPPVSGVSCLRGLHNARILPHF